MTSAIKYVAIKQLELRFLGHEKSSDHRQATRRTAKPGGIWCRPRPAVNS